MKLTRILQVLGFIAICQAAGAIGTIFTIDAIPNWYVTLKQPSFQPPNWLFGPVWTTLYTLMGIAAWRVWSKGEKAKKIKKARSTKFATRLFFVHLFFNMTWSIAFFGYHDILLALINIIIIWISIVWLMVTYWRIDKVSTYLFAPYLLWVSFATVLNAAIFALN